MNPADFLHAPLPGPLDPPEGVSPTAPKRFFNRELSWIAFNRRVLEEAANPHVPLLERVRFLSISASNLDEFYGVRVAGLRELRRSGKAAPSADGLMPHEQLRLIDEEARALMETQQQTLEGLKAELATAGILILNRNEITPECRPFLNEYFLREVFTVISPLTIDNEHPFPFIPTGGLCLGLEIERIADRAKRAALLPVPQQVARFVRLPNADGMVRFLPLEELLLDRLAVLFPGWRVHGHCAFRVLRDSDMEIEEEAEDLVREFEIALKRRRRGDVVRLKITAAAPQTLRALIMAELGVAPDEVIDVQGMLGLADLRELVIDERRDLLWPVFVPRMPERVRDHGGDIFAAIRQKDLLLHHPYETFDLVVQFLEQAARDPNVLAIKQTLYRTSHESPIVAALCEAAEAGKSVTALVELKARFDEAANIRQSRRLERAGAHVVYGFIHYKTHAKMSMVVRREGGRLVTYTHWGTGNYHPITARIYTDLSLFTCDPALGRDAARVFNYLSGYAEPELLENIAISPLSLKARLLELIAAEAEHAQKGRPAAIWAKMNALIDPEVIDALYAASAAGVQIELVVRGICGLRPGIKGLSERIRVKSIVGRFLEHSRIVCFGNGAGLPSDQARIFISSADWMERNFARRVETLVEIFNPTVRAQILRQIMAANLRDEEQSWLLDGHGTYRRAADLTESTQKRFNCHRFFLENPSLSGRGSAGVADVPDLWAL